METSFIHCRSVNVCYQDYIKKLTTKTKYHSPQDFVYCPDGFFRYLLFPSYVFAGYILGLRQCKMIIKFRTRERTSKPQTTDRCRLWFSYLAPYWLISRNTITFHKYFWCSRFCEFHRNV